MGGYLEGRVKYSVFEYSEQRDESVENMNISRGKAGLEEHSHQQAEVTRQETLSVSGVQKILLYGTSALLLIKIQQ